MSTNAINTNYMPAYYAQGAKSASAEKDDEPVSILETKEEMKKSIDIDSACTDGDDDGKLKMSEATGLFLKKWGEKLVNKLTYPVKQLAEGNIVPALITAAGIALTCNHITGPIMLALGAIGGAVGATASGASIISGIKQLNDCAKDPNATDADAKAIVAEMGDDAANFTLSAAALVGSAKAMHSRAKTFAGQEGTKTYELTQKINSGEKVSFGAKAKAYTQDSFKTSFGELTSKLKINNNKPGNSQPANAGQGQPEAPTNTQSSRADVEAKVRYNAEKCQPTNKNLTVEQAQAQFDEANALLQEGVQNRTFKQADYKAAQQLVKEARANLDYAKTAEASRPQLQQDLTKALQQAAETKEQTNNILNTESPQARIDEIVKSAQSETGASVAPTPQPAASRQTGEISVADTLREFRNAGRNGADVQVYPKITQPAAAEATPQPAAAEATPQPAAQSAASGTKRTLTWRETIRTAGSLASSAVEDAKYGAASLLARLLPA